MYRRLILVRIEHPRRLFRVYPRHGNNGSLGIQVPTYTEHEQRTNLQLTNDNAESALKSIK